MSDGNMYDEALDVLLREALSEVEAEENVDLPDELDADFSDEHKAKMKKIFDKEKKARRKKPHRLAPGIAACAAALVIAAGISVMRVEALRVPTLNFFLEHKPTHTSISTNIVPEGGKYETDKLFIGYIPEDYTLVRSDLTKSTTFLIFESGENQIRIVTYEPNSSVSVDTEDAFYEELLINGDKSLYVEKNGEIIIAICDSNAIVIIQGDVSKEVIMKVAQNLTIK